MSQNNTSRFWTWILIAVGTAGVLLVILYLVFPELIARLTGLIAGLFLVVTGMIFRRKK